MKNDMELQFSPIPTSFTEIRQNFDSAYSYVIFENESESGKPESFQDIMAILSRHHKGVLDKVFHRDKSTGRLLLVVKLRTAQSDAIKNKILNTNLPKHIAFYFYDSIPRQERS